MEMKHCHLPLTDWRILQCIGPRARDCGHIRVSTSVSIDCRSSSCALLAKTSTRLWTKKLPFSECLRATYPTMIHRPLLLIADSEVPCKNARQDWSKSPNKRYLRSRNFPSLMREISGLNSNFKNIKKFFSLENWTWEEIYFENFSGFCI